MVMEKGGWTVVGKNTKPRIPNIRGSYWSSRRGKEVLSKEDGSNFFIAEFPEELSAKELFEIFKGYIIEMEVAIPPRRDKRGRRCGFVRFGKVDNERDLATKLDNIFIRGRKLYANVPRFSRERRDQKRKSNDRMERNRPLERTYKGEEVHIGMKENNLRDVEKTYANVLKRGMKEGQGWSKGAQHMEKNNIGWCGKDKLPRFAHLQFDMEEEDMKRFEKAFVGVVEIAGMTYNVQKALHTKGYFKIKATPLGANLCLLTEQEEGEIKALVEEERDWNEEWFSDIHPWTLQDVDNERMTWMRCYGLPCNAWSPKVYAFISSMVGVYVCDDEEIRKHKIMDVATFLVRTKYSLVLNETVNIEINNHVYRIKLVENIEG